MTDASPQPSDDEPSSDEADFRDDALSELMTGVLAAKQMATMSVPGGDANLPAPPSWTPSDSAPKAEALDEASGLPAQIDSGPFAPVALEIDDAHDELGPAEDQIDAMVRRAEAPTAPQPGAQQAALSAAMEELPDSTDDIAAALDIGTQHDDDEEPAAAISTDSGVVVTPQHAKGAQLTGAYSSIPIEARVPAPARRGGTRWVVAGLVVAVAAVAGVAFMNGGRAADTEQAAAGAANDRSSADRTDPTPDPEPAAAPSPAAATPAPEAIYAAAAKRYEQDASNEALLDMTLAACELRDGPDARTAFRKLVGSKARSKAVLECRERGIDLNAQGQGFTAAELAEQAQAAYDDGDATEALELARQSNRTERNQHALMLIVESHCQLSQAEAAEKMLRHIAKKNRDIVSAACDEHGVQLPQ